MVPNLPIDFEGLLRDAYVAILRRGDTAVDCGANLGTHTFQMAQAVAPSGRVIGIEASLECMARLQEALAGPHRRLARVVDLRCIGLAAAPGVAPFYYAPEAPGLSSLRQRVGTVSTPLVESQIHLTTLDFICQSAPRPIRYIKIDVEGAEYEVLQGARETIRADQPLITFEHNADSPKHFGYSLPAFLDFFQVLGYGIFDLFGRPYPTADAFVNPDVWDFVALPAGYPHADALFGALAAGLRQQRKQ